MLSKTVGRKVSVASRISVVLAVALFALGVVRVSAQTAEFTYQGKLNDGGAPAAGNYDFEFRLHDAESGGAPLATQQRLGMTVTGGVFSVRLDFGASFNGQSRWLEVAVKPAGSADPFTTLNPRQPVTSAPYGIRSLSAGLADAAADAEKLGGVAASQYVVTSDARLSDERAPTAGSTHYVQNSTSPQAASNFNISGNGTIGGNLSVAGIFSAPGQLVKSLNGLKDSVTLASGANITITPSGNTLTIASTGGGGGSLFVREQDGTPSVLNVTELRVSNGTLTANGGGAVSLATGGGSVNAILNQTSQQSSANFNIDGTGRANVFNAATQYNIGGIRVLSLAGPGNVFVGPGAGADNTTGSVNSFFGEFAGVNNTTGDGNSFFGSNAGFSNKAGAGNSFFGYVAGQLNTTGVHNSFFGAAAGQHNTTGEDNVFIGRDAGETNTTGDDNTIIGANANVGSSNLKHATAIGAGAVVNTNNTVQLGRNNGNDTVRVPGRLVVATLGSAGSAPLCRNAAGQLAPCSSSLRYKTGIAPFRLGLNLVERLRPITFAWKEDGTRDLGLGAEDVARVEPLLVTYNSKGQIEGVKYDRVAVVLLNAVREQQTQIRQQQQQLDEQQLVIEGLRKLVCQTNPQAQVCRK